MAAPASRKHGLTRPRSAGAEEPGRPPPPTVVEYDVRKYGGRWVATYRGRIIASAGRFAELRRIVRRKGLEDETIFTRVPEDGEFVL